MIKDKPQPTRLWLIALSLFLQHELAPAPELGRELRREPALSPFAMTFRYDFLLRQFAAFIHSALRACVRQPNSGARADQAACSAGFASIGLADVAAPN